LFVARNVCQPAAGAQTRNRLPIVAAVRGTVISFEDELRLGRDEHGGDLGGDIASPGTVPSCGPGRAE
jgi:hypothetical protein